jgi:O-antigen/teichoic acid export membrane protein
MKFLKHIYRIISPESDFTKNFFILFRGTLIAQIIPVLLMPVLTRIYGPEEFGVFELFLSITVILGSIANARYELAVVLPDRKADAWNIMGLGVILSFFFSLLLLLVVSFFADGIAKLLNNSEIKFWLIFVPAAVFVEGVFNMLSYYHTREKHFKRIAGASISRSGGRSLLQILIGILHASAAGLIIGQIFGFIAAILTLMRKMKIGIMLKKINRIDMKRVAKKYKDFPKFTLPATLANSLAVNLTSIMISAMYNIASVGYYSLANRILALPGSLIGKSMSNVYFKEAVDERKQFGHAKNVFFSTIKKLVLLSFPIFLIVFIFSESLFAFVFGDEWSVSGEYARIIIPLLFVRFVFAPISVSVSVFERQKVSLFLQLGLLFLSLLVFALSWFLAWDIHQFLKAMVAILSVYYLFFIFILYRIVSGK